MTLIPVVMYSSWHALAGSLMAGLAGRIASVVHATVEGFPSTVRISHYNLNSSLIYDLCATLQYGQLYVLRSPTMNTGANLIAVLGLSDLLHWAP